MKYRNRVVSIWIALLLCLSLPAAGGFQSYGAETPENGREGQENQERRDAADPAPGEYDGYIVLMNRELPMLFSDEQGEDGLKSVQYLDKVYEADSLEAIAPYDEAGLVEAVMPNYLFELYEEETPPEEPAGAPGTAAAASYSSGEDAWWLDNIGAQEAWDKGFDGQGVTVAVVDSGVISDHEDLQSVRISPLSRNFVAGEDESAYWDTTGHGTFISGLIAADGSNLLGIRGLTDQVTLMELRCFSGRTGSLLSILQAITYAVNNGADVINMSFGLEATAMDANTTAYFGSFLRQAADFGVLLVAAAGNTGNTTNVLNYPAGYDWVVGVGALTSANERAYFSQHNEGVFVAAPGQSLISLSYISPTGYVNGNGTSYSAPLAAALGAMAKQQDRMINQWGFQYLLHQSAADLGTPGYDTDFGFGLIDASALAMELTTTHGIDYELAGGVLGENSPDRFVIGGVTRLVEPRRADYVFDGWYLDEDFIYGPFEKVPAGLVDDVTFYAKWAPDVSVREISLYGGLGQTADGRRYCVKIPRYETMEQVRPEDFSIHLNSGLAQVVNLTRSAVEVALWSFTVTAPGIAADYTVELEFLENSAPELVSAAAVKSGSAAPGSSDGDTPARPFTADVCGWFFDADRDTLTYTVRQDTGEGKAELSGSALTFTPDLADAGLEIQLYVKAADGSLESGEVRVTISVEELAPDRPAPIRSHTGRGGGGGSRSSNGAGIEVQIDGDPAPHLAAEKRPQEGFADVKTGDWYFEAVSKAAESGLFRGVSETRFGPEEEMSRAMMACVLYNLGKDREEFAQAPDRPRSFADVTGESWYAEAVSWMAGAGLAVGTGEELFRPEQPLTREQTAVILYRYAQSCGLAGKPGDAGAEGNVKGKDSDLTTFPDGEKVSDWAREAVSWVVSQGLMVGKSGGQLDPEAGITRAEAASLLVKLVSRTEGAA